MSEQSQDTTETTETTEASIEPVAAPPESSASPDDLTAAAGSTPSDWKTLVPEYGREFQEVKDAKDFDSFFKQYDQLRSYQVSRSGFQAKMPAMSRGWMSQGN